MGALAKMHMGVRIVIPWTHQGMNDDVILTPLTLVIKTGLADSQTPLFHQISLSIAHTSIKLELPGSQSTAVQFNYIENLPQHPGFL